MNIDRVARAMTAGSPSAGFTARVMAPIHGRPRPDFTARVMERVAAARPAVAQSFRPARGLLLVPAALAVIAGVVVLRGGTRIATIPIPPAPRIADLRSGAPVIVTPSVRRETPRRQGVSVRRPAPVRPGAPPIYTIAALEEPAGLSMKSIDPASCTVPALSGPAPLKVTDLPANGGGSRHKDFKETP